MQIKAHQICSIFAYRMTKFRISLNFFHDKHLRNFTNDHLLLPKVHPARLADAIPCLQSSCRNRGLIGKSGRDAATKFTFFNSVRSLLTVPVPVHRWELDREDDSLLFARVPHECVLGVVPR